MTVSLETPRLTVELVPRTAWYTNVRSNVSAAQWNRCKKFVRDRSGDKCEICGGRGQRWPVECHEKWLYDDERHIQVLTGLIALCPSCHECKHVGFAELRGRLPRVKAHLGKVNGWSPTDVSRYLIQCFDLWDQRSRFNWELDTSWLYSDLGPL